MMCQDTDRIEGQLTEKASMTHGWRLAVCSDVTDALKKQYKHTLRLPNDKDLQYRLPGNHSESSSGGSSCSFAVLHVTYFLYYSQAHTNWTITSDFRVLKRDFLLNYTKMDRFGAGVCPKEVVIALGSCASVDPPVLGWRISDFSVDSQEKCPQWCNRKSQDVVVLGNPLLG